MLHEIGRRTSDRKSMGSCRPLLLLFTAMCLLRDHVIVTCIFAYFLIFFKFQGYKNGEVQNQDRIFLALFYSFNFSPYSVIDGYLNSCSAMHFFFVSRIFPLTDAETKINLRVCITCAELLPLLSEQQDPLSDLSCRCFASECFILLMRL